MAIIRKIQIAKYDNRITEPPFLTIPIDTMLIEQPVEDELGEIFAERLRQTCYDRGYHFQFYSGSDNINFDFKVVVK